MPLKEYNISYYADGDEVWMPLTTASDLFLSGSTMYAYYLNGCVYDYGYLQLKDFLKEYLLTQTLKYCYDDSPRAQDIVQFEYSHLCFVIDHLFGNPGLSALG